MSKQHSEQPTGDGVNTPDPEILAAFLEEAPALSERLAAGAEALRGGDLAGLADYARALHGLKGGFLIIGSEREGRYLHAVEDQLDGILAAEDLPGRAELGALLSECAEQIAGWCQALQHGEALAAPAAGLLEDLEAAATAGSRPAQAPVAALPSAPPAPASTGSAAEVADALVPAQAAKPAKPAKTREVQPAAVASAAQPAGLASAAAAVGGARRESHAPRSLDLVAAIAGDLLAARVRLGEQIERLGHLTRQLSHGHQRLGRSLAHARGRHPARAFSGGGGLLDEAEEGSLELTQALLDHDRQGRGLSELLSLMDGVQEGFGDSARALEGLRREVESARRVRLSRLMQALEAAARDAARRAGKQIRFETSGREVQVDQELASELLSPLMHLVRNAVSHGIESEAERQRANKPLVGSLLVRASIETGRLVLELSDDGRGLDRLALRQKGIARGLLEAEVALEDARIPRLIFVRGLSTRESADEVAGRGLGCDEVENVIAGLGGQVEVSSEAGQGTRFRLVVPLERQLVRLLAFRVGSLCCALPSVLVERVGSPSTLELERQGARLFVRDGERSLEVFSLAELLGLPAVRAPRGFLTLRLAGQSVALAVDGLESEREVVVKPLGDLLAGHPLFSGVTAWGLDRLALVLDPRGLTEVLAEQFAWPSAASLRAHTAESGPEGEGRTSLGTAEARRSDGPLGAQQQAGEAGRAGSRNGRGERAERSASPAQERDQSKPSGSARLSQPGISASQAEQISPTSVGAPGQAPRAAGGAPGATPLVPLGPPVRVLYVDDSLAVRRAAAKYLKESRFEVETAVDGLDALTKLSAGSIDLVFTDLEMPRMNGYDLLREMRANPQHAHLPLLVVTSRSSEKHRDEAARLGASGYLTKPYTQAELAELVRAHVPCQAAPDGSWCRLI